MKQTRTLIIGLMFLLATPILASAGWNDSPRTDRTASPRHATVFEVGRTERDAHREVARHDQRREVREVKGHHDERRYRDEWRHRDHQARRYEPPRVVYRSVPARPAPARRPVLVAPLIPLPIPNTLVFQFSW